MVGVAVYVTAVPAQTLVPGLAAMLTLTGRDELTVTVTPAEVADVQPLSVFVTVYVPADETTIERVVAPVLHRCVPVVAEEVSVTDPPEHSAVGPDAEMVGVAGRGFTVTVVAAELDEHPEALVTVTK